MQTLQTLADLLTHRENRSFLKGYKKVCRGLQGLHYAPICRPWQTLRGLRDGGFAPFAAVERIFLKWLSRTFYRGDGQVE
jgi:hypothetical protein